MTDTMHELNHRFQKLIHSWGHMVINLEQAVPGAVEAAKAYQGSLLRLVNAMQRKLDDVESPDTRRELEIMVEKLVTLARHVDNQQAGRQGTGAFVGSSSPTMGRVGATWFSKPEDDEAAQEERRRRELARRYGSSKRRQQ